MNAFSLPFGLSRKVTISAREIPPSRQALHRKTTKYHVVSPRAAHKAGNPGIADAIWANRGRLHLQVSSHGSALASYRCSALFSPKSDLTTIPNPSSLIMLCAHPLHWPLHVVGTPQFLVSRSDLGGEHLRVRLLQSFECAHLLRFGLLTFTEPVHYHRKVKPVTRR